MTRSTWAYVGLTLVGVGLLLGIQLADEDLAEALTREDGLIEYLSALLWLVAAGVAFYAACTVPRARWLAGCWMVFSLFCLGEEISWGQRLLNFATPESVRAANLQGEFNLHNLRALNAENRSWKEAVASGSFTWELLLSTEMIFMAIFGGYFLGLPLLVGVLCPRRSPWGYVSPSGPFQLSLWTILGLSYVLVIAFGGDEPVRETREVFFGLFVAVHLGSLCAAELQRTAPTGRTPSTSAAVVAAPVDRRPT